VGGRRARAGIEERVVSNDAKPGRTLHLIGNSHIDPVWLWQWPEGYEEVRATFRSALDLMREYPELIFTCDSAAYYEWVEEVDPGLFDEIRARVDEGRWEIVGGWWVEPDCNIPSGESFVRHALISQLYFQSKFGRMATVGYNVDPFGHNAMLPQILRKSGMDSYVFMRPGPHEKTLASPISRVLLVTRGPRLPPGQVAGPIARPLGRDDGVLRCRQPRRRADPREPR
jgi:alpha-mannosidase